MERILINPEPSQWEKLAERPAINPANLEREVKKILQTVKKDGDAAVKRYTKKFGGGVPDHLWVTDAEIKDAVKRTDRKLAEAIRLAKKNIEKFHSEQVQKVQKVTTMPGVVCWRKSVAVEKVGLYIPGGSAPLFSTLLMLAIPAKIAGCKKIIVCTPAGEDGKIPAPVLYTASLLGITHIYKSGGAQAVGAMAYGTQTLPKVDKIFGPGNQYVTCAKKLVSADGVAIDMLAGPSEVAVYADDSCIPRFVAADLLSQAEHGADSQVVLVASGRHIVEEIKREMEKQIPLLPRKKIIEKSLRHAWYMVMTDPVQAFGFLNQYAPEHLIIASEKALSLCRYVQNAGSVFLGNFSPESAGDYASGTNHSLPTNGIAKTTGGVSVDSFVKKITFQQISEKGIAKIGEAIQQMAAAEGLEAHKSAVSVRLKKLKNGKF